MGRLFTFLLQLLGVALQHALPYFLGKKQEQLDNAEVVAKKVVSASAEREKIENETRQLSDTDIDKQLIDNGWMRRYEDH